MAFLDRKTVNVLLTILLFASVLGIVYMARAVLAIFCLSILFAYLIDPHSCWVFMMRCYVDTLRSTTNRSIENSRSKTVASRTPRMACSICHCARSGTFC